jgi:tRNA(fMet)-specific endonuclease VapC
MILLDTDIFTLLTARHPRVEARFAAATEEVAITVVTMIEALQGRFDFVLRAADGPELLRAQEWLQQTQVHLARLPTVLFNEAAATTFESLLTNKKLKKIGRGDLLIASTTLANRATLATRNLKDFRQVPGLQIENWAD